MNFSINRALLLLAFLLPSCAHAPLSKTVDKSFLKYAHFFETESGLAFPSDINVYFVDDYGLSDNPDGSRVVGRCYPLGENGGPSGTSISFLKGYWDTAPEEAREILFLHEAGHCALNFDHNDKVDERGVQVSIMASHFSLAMFASYKENKKPFLDQLFPWRNQGVTGAVPVPSQFRSIKRVIDFSAH